MDFLDIGYRFARRRRRRVKIKLGNGCFSHRRRRQHQVASLVGGRLFSLIKSHKFLIERCPDNVNDDDDAHHPDDLASNQFQTRE